MIPTVLNLLFSIVIATNVATLISDFLNGNFDGGIGMLIIGLCFSLFIAIVNMLLNYGMAACITALRRGESVTFFTIFTKQKGRIGKIFGVLGWMTLMAILYVIGTVLIIAIVSFILNLNPIISLIGAIMMIVIYAVFIYKMIELFFSQTFTNYIIYDYPERTSKEILNLAKKIVAKKGNTYIVLLLSIVWIIPFALLQIILSNVDLLIWQPEVSWYFFTSSIKTTAPEWWKLFVNILTTSMNVLLFLKVLSLTSSFYESLEPEKLFDEEHEIQPEKKRYIFIGLGLIILYVVVIVGGAYLWTAKIFPALAKWRYEGVDLTASSSSNDRYTGVRTDIKAAKEENVKVEYVGFTKDDEMVVRVKNEDENPAYIDRVNVEFKDENDEVFETDYASNYNFYIAPNSEIYTYFYDYSNDYKNDEKFKNFDLYVELEDTSSYFFTEPVIVNSEIVTKNTGEDIIIEIKEKLDYVDANVVFFENGEIVAIGSNSLLNGSMYGEASTYMRISIPSIGWYNKIEFDDFKVYIMDASEVSSYASQEELNFEIETEIESNSNNMMVMKIKNENDETISFSDGMLVVKNNNNELIDIVEITDTYFSINPNKEVYVTCGHIKDYKNMKIEFLYDCNTEYLELEVPELKCSDTEDKLKVEITNTSDSTLTDLDINVVFYNNGEIVGLTRGYLSYSQDILRGETGTIEVNHPYKAWMENMTYDDYKVFVLDAGYEFSYE